MTMAFCFEPEVILIPAAPMVDERHAADLLRQQLGRCNAEWSAFLREDREVVPDDCKAIPVTEFDGNYWYDISDVYTYIANENGALMIAIPGKCDGVLSSNSSADSCAAIYTANRTRPAIRLILSDGFMACPWLSANCARELGNRLIELADWSDQHRYSPETLMFETAACTRSSDVKGECK